MIFTFNFKKTLLLSAVLLLISSPAYGLEKEGRQAYYSQTGDTVEKIAFYYDLDGDLLAAMNNVSPGRRLATGTLIWLPLEPEEQKESQSITVTAGDTLWALAKKYGTGIAELCAANNISDSNFLRIGQVLQIPPQNNAPKQTVMVLARADNTVSRGNMFMWPVQGVISSAFGWRSRGWHCGLDIAANYGELIFASASGIVTQAGWRSAAYGNAVMVDHGNGLETLYAHNSQVLVNKGDFVRQGQPIAKIGATGNATGAHVHLEIRLNDICQNPQEYLR